jgi:protein-S-isoprenylcysteine O-methyltransferase Ste14
MKFKIIALGLMAIFYACYFLKMINQKKQGIHTDQLGKGKEGLLKVIEISLKITTYLLPAIQIICILFYSENSHLILRVAGLVIELLGIVIFIASVVEMKDNWRAGVQKEDKTKLVTTGIYTISRNPAFLGFDLMYIGILLTFFNWYLLFATIVAIVLFHLQIVKVEENFLIEAFGQEYLNYKRIVCRYFGNKFWIK